jgi:hypothetical protein
MLIFIYFGSAFAYVMLGSVGDNVKSQLASRANLVLICAVVS